MKKYSNNASGGSPANSMMRFNNHSRYGTNNVDNMSHRQMPQNYAGYKYSPNRNNAKDWHQPKQYESSPNRQLYGANKKNRNHIQSQHSKHSSPYSQKSTISSSSSLSSTYSTAQTVLNSPPTQPNSSATNTAQNIQQHDFQLNANLFENSNYFGYNYNNFFPTFNLDTTITDTTATYSITGGMNPLIWQTITSTPPPKLPQQSQLQPPLPPQLPPGPPQLPPGPPQQTPAPQHQQPLIPSSLLSSDNFSQLPPPPPIPTSITDSTINTAIPPPKVNKNKKHKYSDPAGKTIVKMKAKRRAMSVRYKLNKSWSEQDAILALKAEEVNARKQHKDIILIIRFPDPEISREIIKNYSQDITSVHFQLNFAPRYCLVHLKPGADVEKTIDNLSKIPFGSGFLSVEIKQIPNKVHTTKLNEIDPCTLYVGNLPTTIACKTLKEHFPGAIRIDIGFAQRMKYTRYAFIRYQTVQQAIEAYNRMLDAEIEGRTLTIRFRRLAAVSDGNKDDETETHDDVPGDIINQASVDLDKTQKVKPSDTSSQENCNIDIGEHNSKELSNVNNENSTTAKESTGNKSLCDATVITEHNLEQTNQTPMPIKSTQTIDSAQDLGEKSTATINIKLDPDIDPDDVVVRNSVHTACLEIANDGIKHEENNLALYTEFFDKPNNQNNSCEISNRDEAGSVSSIDDDIMSTTSSTSLRQRLETCQSQVQTKNNEIIAPPPMKRNKTVGGDTLETVIKRESLEDNNIIATENLPLFLNNSIVQQIVKEEPGKNDKKRNKNKKKSSSTQNVQAQIGNKEQIATTNNCEASNNDDAVPPTALFFRNDYQNMSAKFSNDCDYNEFYETRASTISADIKAEPQDISARRRALENINKNIQQSSVLNQSHSININTVSNEIANKNSATTSNTCDDNNDYDLVPTQSLLGSFKPPQKYIKQEMEYDDLFSIPFERENRPNEDSILENICDNNNSVASFTSQTNNIENTTKISKSTIPEENDEDVVIISDNIKLKRIATNRNLPKLFLPQQTDLISFTDKVISLTNSNRKVSKLIHTDNLDRLYDQLDADSDNEL